MIRQSALIHEFVEFMPEILQAGKLYVSIRFATAAHKCCCGCGNEVYTPISPTDWTLIFDGVSVSLEPSIGNWGFSCRSHYWIRHNRVHWAGQWSDDQIEAGRAREARAKEAHYLTKEQPTPPVAVIPPESSRPKIGFLQRLKMLLGLK